MPRNLLEEVNNNMEIIAKLHNLRIAPRKVRLIADLIRGKKTENAEALLNFTTKKANSVLLKLLKQALNNAKNNFHLDASNFFISKIVVDEGPKLKRWRPRARGRAFEIQKKISNITIILSEIKKTAQKIEKTKSEVLKGKPEITEGKSTPAGGEKKVKTEKPQFKTEKEIKKPNINEGMKGIRKLFKRKAI